MPTVPAAAWLTTAISALPSPLKLPTVTPAGLEPTAYDVGARKLSTVRFSRSSSMGPNRASLLFGPARCRRDEDVRFCPLVLLWCRAKNIERTPIGEFET